MKIRRYCVVFLLLVFLTIFPRNIFAEYVYIVNNGTDNISVLDATTLAPIPGSPFTAAGLSAPTALAINPAGTRLYIPNANNGNIVVLDSRTLAPVTGSPAMTGTLGSFAIAINAAGTTVYVTSIITDSIYSFDTTSLLLTAFEPSAGIGPYGIAVHPTMPFVYIPNYVSNNTSVVDAMTLLSVTPPFMTGGLSPYEVAFNPSNNRVYVPNETSNTIAVHDGAPPCSAIVGSPFPTGGTASHGVAINPAGTLVYITNITSSDFSVLDATTLLPIPGSPFPTGGINPNSIAFNAAGTRVYITNPASNNVSVFETATHTPIVGSPFPTGGTNPFGIALATPPPLLSPPSNLTGNQKKNDFGVVFERFNLLSWEASPSAVAGYFIYRDGTKIATLDASALEYKDHNRKKGVTTFYSVTSFDASGNESSPINVEVK